MMKYIMDTFYKDIHIKQRNMYTYRNFINYT